MTFLLPRYRLLQFRDIDILLLRSESFFFSLGSESRRSRRLRVCTLSNAGGLRSYFETIKPGIYMRSRSLTAGSAGQHAYTQRISWKCMSYVYVRACMRRISYLASSMIFNHNRSSKGLDFAEKGKKISAHAYRIHACLDANQGCVCMYTFTRSIPVPKSAAVDTRCERFSVRCDDATTHLGTLPYGAGCHSFNCHGIQLTFRVDLCFEYHSCHLLLTRFF